MIAEFIVGVGGNMVEFVYGNQAAIERFYPKLVYCEAKGGVGANQHFGIAIEKLLDRIDFAAVVAAGSIAEVPLGFDLPICPEAKLTQGFIMEAGADRFLWDNDDGLLEVLVFQFVEGDEHECPTFAGGGGRFDQKVLFAAFLVGAFLHGAHSQGVGAGGGAILGVGDGNGGNGAGITHKYFSAKAGLRVLWGRAINSDEFSSDGCSVYECSLNFLCKGVPIEIFGADDNASMSLGLVVEGDKVSAILGNDGAPLADGKC